MFLGQAHAFEPVRVTTDPAQVNANFLDIAKEIGRVSLVNGGTVNQNLKISSSVHVTGNLQIDGTATVKSSLTVAGVFGVLHKIASTTVSDVTFTNTSFSACVATVTILCDRTLVEVWYTGPLENATSGSITFLNVLKDGAFISPYTTDIGINSASTSNTSTPINGCFSRPFLQTAGVSTTWCLAPRVNNSTGRIRNDANHIPSFGVTCL